MSSLLVFPGQGAQRTGMLQALPADILAEASDALGEDVRKAAEKKFQEINDAKEKIFKARGL